MLIIGLTGSIGTGKSTTGKMFAECGIPVYDADAAVHALYDGGAAVEPVGKRFPDAIVDGRIDREKLSKLVVGKREEIEALEKIVHPLVHELERAFLDNAREKGRWAVLLEIPLLFETGGEDRCDLVVVTSVAPQIQRERVTARDGMTTEKFEAILAKQMPDAEKRRRAHFIVDTGQGLDAAKAQVCDIVRAIRAMR